MLIGLEILRDSPQLAKSWGRCGLMMNQASVTRDFSPSWQVLQSVLGDRLIALFGPQHGLVSTVQDNMIESGHSRHGPSGLPVYSLYSETREPSAAMLANLDTMIIDIQIVGCRVYTFKYTIAAILRAAKKHGKKVVVLDRPNPLGGSLIEGRTLSMDVTSFVGEFPIPMRHGLTPGECAGYFNREIGAPLEVVLLKNWVPDIQWSGLSRHWVLTSPNLPTIDSVYVYPGMVAFEGTNVSEGRGTGLPFQFIGAPFVDAEKFAAGIRAQGAFDQAVYLRPTQFQPTSQKWAGQVCNGVQLHVLDHRRVNSYALALAMLHTLATDYPRDFQWREPGYEYDFKNAPIDLIIGQSHSGKAIADHSLSVTGPLAHFGVSDFLRDSEAAILYPRQRALNT